MIAATHRVLAVMAATVLASAFGVATAKEKAPATVVCKDGSTDEGGRGACRGHGGVDKAATKAKEGGEEKASAKAGTTKAEKAKEDVASEPMVTCKDGTQSKGGRGACRGHGGVDKGAGKGATPASATTKSSEAATTKPTEAGTAKAAEATTGKPPAAATSKVTAKGASAAAKTEEEDSSKGPPTAKCKDGTLSYAKHHTGACSRHGGVEEWLTK